MKKTSTIILFIFLSCLCLYAQERDTSYYRGELDEAVITVQRKKMEETSNVIKLTAPNIKSLPAIFGEVDVIKAIQFTPGISGGKEGDTGIRIRGGNFDQSMILMDGASIYNPSHFRGLVSSFNPDVLGETTIFKGGFPAKYGGRLSGIVDVALRDGNKESYHGAITVGLLSSRLYFEGPVKKNTSSFIISARKSYYNLYLGRLAEMAEEGIMDIADILDGMDYYDINAKYMHILGSKDKLSASLYIGNDYSNAKNSETHKYDYNPDEDKSSQLKETRYRYSKGDKMGNIASTFHWDHTISPSRTLHSLLTYSEYKSRTYTDTESESRAWTDDFDYLRQQGSFESGISDLTLKVEYIDDTFKNHTLAISGGYTLQRVKSTVEFTSHKANLYDTLIMSGNNGYKEYVNTFHISLDDQMVFWEKLKIGLGVRLNNYFVKNSNYLSIEPRVRLRYSPIKTLRLTGSFTIMSQAIHLLSSNNIVSKHDLWVPSTSSYAPTKAHQGTIGIEYEYKIDGNPVIISLEGYYKKMSNLLEYIEGSSLASNKEWGQVVTDGDGLAYGAEFFIHKPFGSFSGSLSYTWSKSIRQFEKINGGEWFYDKNDHRHNLTAMMTQKIGKNFFISLSFQMRSGDWYDLETAKIPIVNMALGINPNLNDYDAIYHMYGIVENVRVSNLWVPVSTGKNKYKSDLYHKMDMSLTYNLEHKKGRSEFNLTVANIYNKQNPYYIYLSNEYGYPTLNKVCLFPIMPSISYTYRF